LATTTVANTSGSDYVVNLPLGTAGGVNYRLLPASQTIVNTSTAATVYWNFTLSSVGTGSNTLNNWNFILTDVATPADTAGSSEVQFNFDSSGAGGLFRARNGTSNNFYGLSTTAARLLAT
jgi:hypothetical protein